MSDTTSQEPTMEEILASIRRIISEDDAPAAAEPAPEEEPVAAAAPEEPLPIVEDEEDDGVLELTERVETMGDLDVYTPPGPADEPEPLLDAAPSPFEPDPEPLPELPPVSAGQRLVGDPAATAAAAAFGHLSSTLLMGNAERTLEDVVRELLRPLLKQWLDDNLPRIVEATVAEEVERIARNRVR
jgi:cell pole-organizing protein PopZ